jgi:methionyl-tRNA formyltransferase
MLKKKFNILYFGRNNCNYSKQLAKFYKKKSKTFYLITNKINIKIKNLDLDFIFCFRSYYILKQQLINKAKIAAINFHPGPPNFRGIGCVNFALYKNSKKYGSTAHMINNNIDNGKIIDVKKFNIKDKDNVRTLLSKTHKLMYKQALYVSNALFKNPKKIGEMIKKNKFNWSKKITTRHDLNNFYRIRKNITKNQLKRIIRATYTKKFKPFVLIHNKKFILE